MGLQLIEPTRGGGRNAELPEKPMVCCGALLTLVSVSCSPASAEEIELVYRATLNEGSAPLSGFLGQPPLPVGTPLTITAGFDASSADQWNTGAYIYGLIPHLSHRRDR
jgi:hypothetical protein